jgi:ubiquinone/menaquinone biosynthesis C-methylase UbiE
MRTFLSSRWLRYAARLLAAGVNISAAATALMFPYSTDPLTDQAPKSREFYASAYANSDQPQAPLSEKEEIYINSARTMADFYHVPALISDFVQHYQLAGKKVLEVGAGSGLLQDHVADYTALDISPTARRFFHKPFVEASATEMPFPDASFDALWTIWVLEHIPNPELALNEMRRVTKPGGFMFLYPALDVSRFTADGLHVRPYGKLDGRQKFYKSLIPIAESKAFHLLYFHQVRILRSLATRLSSAPSRFHFIRLEPNYDHYWEGDSDATTSLSNHELYLWFKTRGDTCLNCPSEARLTLRDHPTSYLISQKNAAGTR